MKNCSKDSKLQETHSECQNHAIQRITHPSLNVAIPTAEIYIKYYIVMLL